MAGGSFNANAYDPNDIDIHMNRKHGRIMFDPFPLDGFILDMPVADFVGWCQAHGTKLRTKIVGSVYNPDFRDDEAMELFRATWLVEFNLSKNAKKRRPTPYGEAA